MFTEIENKLVEITNKMMEIDSARQQVSDVATASKKLISETQDIAKIYIELKEYLARDSREFSNQISNKLNDFTNTISNEEEKWIKSSDLLQMHVKNFKEDFKEQLSEIIQSQNDVLSENLAGQKAAFDSLNNQMADLQKSLAGLNEYIKDYKFEDFENKLDDIKTTNFRNLIIQVILFVILMATIIFVK